MKIESKVVYLVQHEHKIVEDFTDIKTIGIYSSRKKAEEAVERLKNQPGFKDTTKGFSIDEYGIDRDRWVDGFITE